MFSWCTVPTEAMELFIGYWSSFIFFPFQFLGEFFFLLELLSSEEHHEIIGTPLFCRTSRRLPILLILWPGRVIAHRVAFSSFLSRSVLDGQGIQVPRQWKDPQKRSRRKIASYKYACICYCFECCHSYCSTLYIPASLLLVIRRCAQHELQRRSLLLYNYYLTLPGTKLWW